MDTKSHKHHAKPSGKFKGAHAMVMVGARRDDSGQYFLLQNWWKEKQFVEVSEAYLQHCSATVFFVETPQTGVPPGNSTHEPSIHSCETEMLLDKAEGLEGG